MLRDETHGARAERSPRKFEEVCRLTSVCGTVFQTAPHAVRPRAVGFFKADLGARAAQGRRGANKRLKRCGREETLFFKCADELAVGGEFTFSREHRWRDAHKRLRGRLGAKAHGTHALAVGDGCENFGFGEFVRGALIAPGAGLFVAIENGAAPAVGQRIGHERQSVRRLRQGFDGIEAHRLGVSRPGLRKLKAAVRKPHAAHGNGFGGFFVG